MNLLIVCDLLDFDATFFVSACVWKFIAFDSNYDYRHIIVTSKVVSLRVSDKRSNNNKSVTTITTTMMTTN